MPGQTADRRGLRELAEEYGLRRVAQEIERMAQPAIRLNPKLSPDRGIPVGASKIGGQPDLPAESRWPARATRPLSFILQVNLGEVAPLDERRVLPQRGVLSFFYDAQEQPWGFDHNHRDGFQILYADSPQVRRRRAFPDDLNEESRFPAAAVVVSTQLCLEPYESLAVEALELVDEEEDAYLQLRDAVDPEDPSGFLPTRLLGYPLQIQGEMQTECQMASHGISMGDGGFMDDPRVDKLRKGARDWRLLLQVGSDDSLRMMWGDLGALYVWITEDALRRRAFEECWGILQCS